METMKKPNENEKPGESAAARPTPPSLPVEMRRRESFRWPEPAEPREIVERGYGWGV